MVRADQLFDPWIPDSAFAGEKGLSWNGLDDRGWCVRESKNNVKVSARREPKLFKINVKKLSDEKAEFYVEGNLSTSLFSSLTVASSFLL